MPNGDADAASEEVKSETAPVPTPSNTPKVDIDFDAIQEQLKVFLSSEELEVQERAGTLHNFIKCYQKLKAKAHDEEMGEIAVEIVTAFSSELNPVAAKAQKKVPVPEGLDLDAWINDPPSESEEEEEEEEEIRSKDVFVKSSTTDYGAEKRQTYQPTEEELAKVRQIWEAFIS